ncbi:MAG: SCPU domain-containing protein [Sphingobium sp.]|nr:SCPU domain-containing protein [Sphingobium sp.]
MKYTGLAIISALSVTFMASQPATAQSVNGSIDATMTLTSGCAVNGNANAHNTSFGILDFGSHNTLFTEATAQVAPTGNGAALVVQCTAGLNASIAITGGENDAAVVGSNRAMAYGGTFIPYDIYSDAAYQTVMANNVPIAIPTDGTPLSLPIYGRALGTPGLVPGTYTDIISLTLSF